MTERFSLVSPCTPVRELVADLGHPEVAVAPDELQQDLEALGVDLRSGRLVGAARHHEVAAHRIRHRHPQQQPGDERRHPADEPAARRPVAVAAADGRSRADADVGLADVDHARTISGRIDSSCCRSASITASTSPRAIVMPSSTDADRPGSWNRRITVIVGSSAAELLGDLPGAVRAVVVGHDDLVGRRRRARRAAAPPGSAGSRPRCTSA